MKRTFFSVLLCLTVFRSLATHIPYADMTYRWISGNDYVVTMTVYRECGGVPAAASLTIFRCRDISCGGVVANGTLENTDPIGIPMYLVCGPASTNCDTGSVIGYEKYVYEDTLTFDPCFLWTLQYSLCCRNFAITNTASPMTEQLGLEITFNNADFSGNSSPTWDTEPLLYICCDTSACYDQSATDADGDSLVYSLYNPFDTHASSCTPFDLIPYLPGFSFTNPFTSVSGMTIDPLTGFITVEPIGCSEVSVMGVQIDEYRDGDLIGTIRRDNMVILNAGDPVPCPVDSTVGIDVQDHSFVELFPNPSDGIFQILAPDKMYDLIIFDARGVIIQRLNANDGSILNLSECGKGLYFYRYQSQTGKLFGKLVLE